MKYQDLAFIEPNRYTVTCCDAATAECRCTGENATFEFQVRESLISLTRISAKLYRDVETLPPKHAKEIDDETYRRTSADHR